MLAALVEHGAKFDRSFERYPVLIQTTYIDASFGAHLVSQYAFALAHRMVEDSATNVKKCQFFRKHEIDI